MANPILGLFRKLFGKTESPAVELKKPREAGAHQRSETQSKSQDGRANGAGRVSKKNKKSSKGSSIEVGSDAGNIGELEDRQIEKSSVAEAKGHAKKERKKKLRQERESLNTSPKKSSVIADRESKVEPLAIEGPKVESIFEPLRDLPPVRVRASKEESIDKPLEAEAVAKVSVAKPKAQIIPLPRKTILPDRVRVQESFVDPSGTFSTSSSSSKSTSSSARNEMRFDSPSASRVTTPAETKSGTMTARSAKAESETEAGAKKGRGLSSIVAKTLANRVEKGDAIPARNADREESTEEIRSNSPR